jgi:hemophore-related protein
VRWLERSSQLVTLSLTRMVAAVGGLALSLTAGAGVATADPDLGPVINTTCNYSQVLAALNAQSPAAAAQLNASPTAQSVLRGFLDSSPDERQQIAQELQSRPGSQQYFQQYVGVVLQVANTCNNY